MMRELTISGYSNRLETAFPLINAVLSGLQDGIVFSDVDDRHYYILHKSGFSYLTKNNVDYIEVLNLMISSEKIPRYFHVYDPDNGLIAATENKNEQINVKIRRRVQLKFKKDDIGENETNLPVNFVVRKIDFQNFNHLSVFNLELSSKFWKSEEDFINHGFGFCVFNEVNQPVCICYTACVVGETAEIDIATLPEYQNRGLAKSAVTTFVRHCVENNITANWDCFEDNYSSLKTAQGVGFNHIATYNLLSIFNKSKDHETQ